MSYAPPIVTSPAEAAGTKWAALHDAAAVVAMLAGLEQESHSPEVYGFPAAIRAAAPWRQALAETGVDDLAAILEPGIGALLAVNARGADARAPALALWHEFRGARDALLTLVVPEHA